jgi:hypothetical protein
MAMADTEFAPVTLGEMLTEDEAEMFRCLVKRVCGHLAPFAADEEGKD